MARRLSNEEFNEKNTELIIRAKAGDKQALEELFELNERLHYRMANMYGNPNNFEDIVSVSRLGLYKAYQTFDPNKGAKFITYARKVMENEIFQYFRKDKKRKDEASLDEIIYTDKDGDEFTLHAYLEADPSTTPEYQLEVAENIAMLHKALWKISARKRCIIVNKYFRGKTQKELSEQLKISQSYISRIERSALKELKREMEKINILKERKELVEKMRAKIPREKIAKLIYLFDLIDCGEIRMTFKQIANLVDVSIPTVRKYFEKYKEGEFREHERIKVEIPSSYVQMDRPKETIEVENVPNITTTINKYNNTPKRIQLTGSKVTPMNIADILGSVINVLDQNETYNFYIEVRKR